MLSISNIQRELSYFINKFNKEHAEKINLNKATLYDLWRLAETYEPVAFWLFYFANAKLNDLCLAQVENNHSDKSLSLIYRQKEDTSEDFNSRLKKEFSQWQLYFTLTDIAPMKKTESDSVANNKSKKIKLNKQKTSQTQQITNETSAWLSLFYLVASSNTKLCLKLFNTETQSEWRQFAQRVNSAVPGKGLYESEAMTQFHPKHGDIFRVMHNNYRYRKLLKEHETQTQAKHTESFPALSSEDLGLIYQHRHNFSVMCALRDIADNRSSPAKQSPIKQESSNSKNAENMMVTANYNWQDEVKLKLYRFFNKLSFGRLFGEKLALAILKREAFLKETTEPLRQNSIITTPFRPSHSTPVSIEESKNSENQTHLNLIPMLTPPALQANSTLQGLPYYIQPDDRSDYESDEESPRTPLSDISKALFPETVLEEASAGVGTPEVPHTSQDLTPSLNYQTPINQP